MPGIVVGVDGSAHSVRALEWAVREAALRHTPLNVISVHPALVAIWGAVNYPEGSVDAEQARREAHAAVDKAASALPGPLPEVNVRVVAGAPALELIGAAQGADLVVVGSRGSGGFARLLLGSVSSQVVQHAPCPVVVTPPGSGLPARDAACADLADHAELAEHADLANHAELPSRADAAHQAGLGHPCWAGR